MKKISGWLSLVFVFISLPLAAQNVTTPPAETRESQFFDAGGVRIHFIAQGKGDAVIWVPGFTGSAQGDWQQLGVLEALARDYRVIAIDNRAHGLSDKPHDPKQYGIEMVSDLERLMDHLGIDKAHIIGYSMGGLLTNKLLSIHPERFLSATLGGAGILDEQHIALFDALADSLMKGEGTAPLIRLLTPPGQPVPTEEEMIRIDEIVLGSSDRRALGALAAGSRDWVVPENDLRNNSVPVLVLVGGSDPLKEGAYRLQGVLAKMQFVVIEGTDHGTTPRDARFAQAVANFLGQHAGDNASH